jgi:hypothetical protein
VSASLASLLSQALSPADGVTFRVGVVVAWSAGSNQITVGGQTLDDLPYLDGVAASPADRVALFRCNNTLLVAGVIVQPT